ncbi:MAG: recombinase family protein [bacterium]
MDNVNLSKYKIAAYIRLSDEDRNKINRGDESESIINQRSIINDYIVKCNGKVSREYIDDGLSGTNFERPAFEQMIKDIETKNIDLIITKDLSRLGRDHIETGYYIEKYFPENRIRYIAITDYYDSFITSNELVLFKLTFNDMYSKDISKKIISSFDAKKRQGLYLGSFAPYGYKKNPENRHQLIIDSNTSVWVRKMVDLILENKSSYFIAEYLTDNHVPIPSVVSGAPNGKKVEGNGIWYSSTVRRILSSQIYVGDMVQSVYKKVNYKSKKIIKNEEVDWIIVKNTHEAIITREEFEIIRNKLENSNKVKNTGDLSVEKPLLSGLLICAECGRSISIQRKKAERSLYRRTYCNYYRKHSKRNLCTPHSLKYEKLELTILEYVENICKNYLNDIEYEKIINKSKDVKKEEFNTVLLKIKHLEKEIQKINEKISTLYEDKINDVISLELFKMITKEEEKKSIELNKQLKELNEISINMKSDTINDEKNNKKIIKEFIKSKYKSRDLINSIIEKIVISEEKEIDIYFRIKELKYFDSKE